jgi:hypothetical protein
LSTVLNPVHVSIDPARTAKERERAGTNRKSQNTSGETHGRKG